MLLVGPPGSGKSAIAAWLAETRSDIAAGYFCSGLHRRSLNPFEFVACVVANLAESLDPYAAALRDCYPRIQHETAADTFRALVLEPASKISAPPRPCLIVVDALDEALMERGVRRTAESIVDVLASHMGRMPNWLRFVLTTQPVLDILNLFRDQFLLNLEGFRDESSADLEAYFRARLGNRYSPVGPQLVTLAGTNFLYARTLADALVDGSLGAADVGTLTPGLSAFFSRLAQRRFPGVESYRRELKPLLDILVAARAPVPTNIIAESLRLEPDVLLDRIRALRPYLQLRRDGPVESYSLFHDSFRRWLADSQQAGAYAAHPANGHRMLADCGWRWLETDAETLPDYFLTHLAMHTAEADDWERLLTLLRAPRLGLLRRWLDEGQTEEGSFCLEGMITHVRKKHANSALLPGLLTQAARLYSRRGHYDRAEALLQEAFGASSILRARREHAVAMHELGSLQLYRQRYEDAEARYHRALWYCRVGRQRYRDEEAANLIGLATAAFENFRLKRAGRLADRATVTAHRAGDIPHHVAALRISALVSRGMLDHEAAESSLKHACALAALGSVTVELPRLGIARGWLIYDRSALSNTPATAACTEFREALGQAEAQGNYYLIAEAKLSLAWCYLTDGDAEAGQAWLEQLVPILRPGRHSGLWCGAEVARAVPLHVRRNLDQAAAVYAGAVALCAKNRNITWRVRALIGLGSVSLLLDERTRAEEAWKSAAALAASASPAVQHHQRGNRHLSRGAVHPTTLRCYRRCRIPREQCMCQPLGRAATCARPSLVPPAIRWKSGQWLNDRVGNRMARSRRAGRTR